MATTGNLDRWADSFPPSLVPQIIRLLLDSWENFTTNRTHEVPITQEFFAVLDRNHEFLKLPFLIDLEVPLPSADGTETLGRLDLRFIYGYCRKVYFSVECKRLRIHAPDRFKALSYEYVTEGMVRYFNGQYAQDLDKGGMLGYVMDGDCNEAVADVQKSIEKRRLNLNMEEEETLRASSCIASKQVKETLHKYGPAGRFTIYHVFLPMNIAAPNTN
jgi:hypothetical protein